MRSKKFYEFCKSKVYTIAMPVTLLVVLFIIAACLVETDESAAEVCVIIMACCGVVICCPLFMMHAWYCDLPTAIKEAYENGTYTASKPATPQAKPAAPQQTAQPKPAATQQTSQARPASDTAAKPASKPIQVTRTKTSGSADSGNYSCKTTNVNLSVQSDPASGTQTATFTAEKYRTKTTTRTVNLSHQHQGKTSSQSVTVTAYRYKTTTSYETIVVSVEKQKVPASGKAKVPSDPARITSVDIKRLPQEAEEEEYYEDYYVLGKL